MSTPRHHRPVIRAAVSGLALAGSLLLPDAGPAVAAPTWLTPGHVLSDATHEAADVHVAVAPAGHTMAVWREQVGASYTVRMSERGPGGLWTVPVSLWSGPELPFSLVVVLDDAGRAAVAFTTSANSGKSRVRVTSRSSFSAAWPLPDAMGGDPVDTMNPDLALAPDGAAWLSFIIDSGAGEQVAVVTSTDGQDWDGPVLNAVPTTVGAPMIAVDAAGVPTVAWPQIVAGQGVVMSRTHLATDTWMPPVTHSTGFSELSDLVTTGTGDVALLWHRFNGSTYRLFVRTRAATGAWGAVTPVTDESATSPSGPHLAVDSAGRGTVTFLGWTGSIYQVRAVSQDAQGLWSGPVILSAPGPSSMAPEVVVDLAGVATVVWVTADGASSTAFARRRPAGGVWGPVETLGPSHVSLFANGSVGVDRGGNVVAAWEAPGAHTVGRVAALDAAGPALGVPTLPAPAYAGKRASMSLGQPVDAWSQVAQVAWGFGDGGSATGLTAGHTWRKRGSYPVVVTATDAVGNSTTKSTVVTVIGRPQLSKVRLSRVQLNPGPGPGARTRLSFRLDTRAAVRATVRRPGGRVLVALARKQLAAGRHVLALSTTMKGVRLPVGTYRVTLVATNPAGKGKPRAVTLTVSRG